MIKTIIILLTLIFLHGCSHFGPNTISRDRFDYNTAISESWKDQTLLNIVKLRYADMPFFVEVSSIVSGYTLESSINLSGIHSGGNVSDILNLGGTGKFSDRPTITYVPITGKTFNKSFMTPIPPYSILFLLQSGWPVDLVIPLTTRSINGMKSRVTAGANQHIGDPDYYQTVSLLRDLQKSNALGMRFLKTKQGSDSTVLFFYDKHLSDEVRNKLKTVNSLLGLNLETRTITVSYGAIPKDQQEIAMLTNSLLQIMITLATQIEVPDKDIKEGRTVPALNLKDSDGKDWRLIDIKHSVEKPENAFTSVKYRDHWYWIDDRDFKSKRTFAFLMIIFSLTETGGKDGLPLVTIPAG